ncbi:MAG: MurR/RpiR family transcriptional regulator [Geminicoccaceae bacterium]
MEQTERLAKRILDQYDAMPRGERRLADLLLEQPMAVIEQSAAKLAERAAVSKATTTRFFQRLGYPSFKAAQRTAREQGIDPQPVEFGARMQRLADQQMDLSQHLQSEVQNLVRSIEQQRSDDMSRAVRMLARADKLWVVGFGDNYPLAHFARALLIKIRPDIRMIPIGGFSVPEEFASISPSDTMLAFGLSRRTRALRNILRSAAQADAKTVFVTDYPSQPSAGGETVMLRCRSVGAAVFDSPTAAVSLMIYLCSSLAAHLGEASIERLRRIESIHSDWEDGLDGDW